MGDSIDYKKLKQCRKTIIEKYGNSVSSLITTKLLFSLYIHNKANLNVKFIYVRKTYFKNADKIIEEKKYERFYKQFKSRENMFLTAENEDFLICNEELSEIILSFFTDIYNDEKIKSNDRHIIEQNDEESIIDNIYTLSDFKKKFNGRSDVIELDSGILESNCYVPNKILHFNNIHSLINNNEDFKFIMNPLISLSKYFDAKKTDNIIKLEFNIIRKVTSSNFFGDHLVSQYSIQCPRCAVKFNLMPYQTHKNIKHFCGGAYEPANQAIKSTACKAETLTPLFLYEIELLNNENDGSKDKEGNKVYIYSFETNLKPGRYVGDIFNTIGDLDKNKQDMYLVFLLGYKHYKPKVSNSLISNNESINWCKENKLPNARFLDALFSVRNCYKNYTTHLISDKGFLLQLFVTISGLGKLIFNYDKLGISVIGNKSLSKTYIGSIFSMLLDRDYHFIQSGEDVSGPGLKGGINNKKLINGQNTSIFEHGIFTISGLTVFDEGENFYRDDLLNSTLKTFLNRTITISKIGGREGIEQNYTPLIFCNFFNFQKNEYVKEIENNYNRFYNSEIQKGTVEKTHGTRKTDTCQYVRRQNLFLPLNYYKSKLNNNPLCKAIALVRERYTNSEIDWRTGGSMASSYRLLFDVICWNTKKKVDKDNQRKSGFNNSILPLISQLPYESFQEELKLHYNPSKIKIDLYDELYNSDEVNHQLQKLKENISKFLLDDGLELHKHLSHNSVEMDEKLSFILYNAIIVMQLCEDINSVSISENIKMWCKLIFLKCKRGVSQNEYDFKTHNLKYDEVDYDYISLEADIEDIEKDEESVRIAKNIIELEEKKEIDERNEQENNEVEITLD